MIPNDQTILRYIAPTGTTLTLSGGPDAGRYGVWAGHDPNGLGSIEAKQLFDAAARRIGEEYVGTQVDHQEIELPIFILKNPKTGVNGVRHVREWLKTLFQRDQVGWLMCFTPVTGWRWLAVRRGYLKPMLGADPAKQGGLHLNLMLIVEDPLARVADSTDEWTNEDLSGSGSLVLHSGDEYDAWPRFSAFGPGTLRLRYGVNDMTFPNIPAGHELLINTDEARPTVRLKRPDGTFVNYLPLMKGKKFREPIFARQITRVDVSITGGNANSGVFGSCKIQHEGLM